MKTELLGPLDTGRAAQILQRGGLVGLPTETVYGLGADGLNPLAVQGIFQAKGRPQDNPLILHIPDPTWLERYCEEIPLEAWQLARRFWPGPLTMILKCRRRTPEELEELKQGPVCSMTHFGPHIIPDVVTAGLTQWGCAAPPTPSPGPSSRRPGSPSPPPRGTPRAGPAPPPPSTCWRIWMGRSTPLWTAVPARWGWSPPSWI